MSGGRVITVTFVQAIFKVAFFESAAKREYQTLG